MLSFICALPECYMPFYLKLDVYKCTECPHDHSNIFDYFQCLSFIIIRYETAWYVLVMKTLCSLPHATNDL